MAGGNRFSRYAEGAPSEAGNRFARYAAPAEDMNGFQSFLSGAADAASFGWGDDLVGVVGGEQAMQDSRRRQEMARAEHPMAFMGGQLAGAVGFGGAAGAWLRAIPAVGRIAAGLGPLQRIGVGAVTGAIGGGLYGAGDAGDGQRLQSAIGGALWGAPFGAGGQVLGEIAGHVGGQIGRAMSPEARAAAMVGGMQARYGQTGQALRQALQDAPDNAIVGDVIPGGSSMIQGAATRPSAGRDALRDFYDARNSDMGARASADIDRRLLGGAGEETGSALRRLEDVQKAEAAPLYAQVYRQTLAQPTQPMRAFIAFHDRPGATFNAALQTTRETMRRQMGVNATDAEMMSQPMFWHRLLENVESDVGASFRAARVNPLGAPRGSAIADMTQDARALNIQVRRHLGADFRKAQDIYAGAAKSQAALEEGADAVSTKLDSVKLAQMQRRMKRMSAGERAHFKLGAANALKDMLANADTGTGRADTLRAVLRNAGQRRLLSEIFAGEKGFNDLLADLDKQHGLFRNSVEAGVGVNSHTADKLAAREAQIARTNPFSAASVRDAVVKSIFGEAGDQYDEAVSNQILTMMRTPVADALREIDASGGVANWAKGRGLLSRAAKERQRIADGRRDRFIGALTSGITWPLVGGSATEYAS